MRSTSDLDLETGVYEEIKRRANKFGWRYLRVDTTDQKGFPDILLLRKGEYWLIEGKLLKKKKLSSISDDIHWQFGQQAVMKRSITLNLNYMLAVGKGREVAFIKGESNDGRSDYPDFIGLI